MRVQAWRPLSSYCHRPPPAQDHRCGRRRRRRRRQDFEGLFTVHFSEICRVVQTTKNNVAILRQRQRECKVVFFPQKFGIFDNPELRSPWGSDRAVIEGSRTTSSLFVVVLLIFLALFNVYFLGPCSFFDLLFFHRVLLIIVLRLSCSSCT